MRLGASPVKSDGDASLTPCVESVTIAENSTFIARFFEGENGFGERPRAPKVS